MVDAMATRHKQRDAPHAESSSRGAAELPLIIGSNLRRLRTWRRYSLDELAGLSHVSRSMLHQVESCKSTPTIVVLWKIARALDVEVDDLLSTPARPGQLNSSTDNAGLRYRGTKFSSRSLLPNNDGVGVEVYELRIASRQSVRMDQRQWAARVTVAVSMGKVTVRQDNGQTTHLSAGDALTFGADAPHSYRNMAGGVAMLFVLFSHH